jgi:pimeloyl-ACP methyl ester carboxylesterase
MVDETLHRQHSDKHVVVLVHGIRTRAGWQNVIRHALEEKGFIVEPTNYERFDLFRFLFPDSYFRNRAADKVWEQIEQVIQKYPNARISYIAHSFGTYILAALLKRKLLLHAHKIIFCGSVLRYDFPFQEINHKFDSPIVNEVGTRDIWPAMAEAITWGYGSAGTYGFRRPNVRDRWHNDFDHADFFDSAVCNKYWVSYLRGEPYVEGDVPAKDPPWWIQIISILKPKYGLLLSFLALVFAIVLYVTCGASEGEYKVYANNKYAAWGTLVSDIKNDIEKKCALSTLAEIDCGVVTWVVGRRYVNIVESDHEELRRVVTCTGDIAIVDRDPVNAIHKLQTSFPSCIRIEETPGGLKIKANAANYTEFKRRKFCGCSQSDIEGYR